jgi:outer membrane protein TolC
VQQLIVHGSTNSERDYELALRDLRVTLGGDYRATEIEVRRHDLLLPTLRIRACELREKALAARPDLKAAQFLDHRRQHSLAV